MSVIFENTLKNSKAFSIMRRDAEHGLSHAYMVVSPDDDIVESFFELTAALICCNTKSACMECAGCRSALHGTHADIAYINKKREKIKVEDISKSIISTVDIKPLGERKLYFVYRADLMLPAAQNKLLKTLEDPPKDVTIFLGVSNESSMLETIRSRARKLYMDAFDEQTVKDALVQQGVDDRTASVAAACSEGLLGKALKISQGDEYTGLYSYAVEILRSLGRSSDVLSVDGLFTSRQDIGKLLDVLSVIIRDMLVFKSDPELILSKHMSAEIAELAGGYSERALAVILSKINLLRKKLSLNVNPTASVDSLLFDILEVKHKWQ